jgi:uncharacterized protein (DUF58 family)
MITPLELEDAAGLEQQLSTALGFVAPRRPGVTFGLLRAVLPFIGLPTLHALSKADRVHGPNSTRTVMLPHFAIPQVWIRFLLAIGGLILAFAAALFSSVSRESGNLWATLILASIALLLAVFVGITTVPYLAKRVAGSRIRDAVDYKVTKLGLIYVTVVLLIGIAALNTGNNLLYIVVAAMLAAILVSGIASAVVLRDLELDVRLPEHVFAGEPVRGRLALRNPRRWMPSLSVSIVPFSKDAKAKQWQWKPATFAFPPRRPPHEQWLKLPDRKLQRVARDAAASHIFSGDTYFPYIPSRGELKADLDFRFDRRGRYREESFGLSTRFPFAFLTKIRRVAHVREIIVYPSVLPTGDQIELIPRIAGEIETFCRGRGNDLYRLREYTVDDSARHIDWKATAKTGSLKVREFSAEENRKLRIVFDNPSPGTISAKKYEEAVATAASLAWHFAAQESEVSFANPEGQEAADVHRFLRFLATVEPKRSPSILDNLKPSDNYNIIITARNPDDIPAFLLNCAFFVFVGPQP